ncbi:MAG: IS1634 family transposase, partial [Thermoplasmata archaeon]
FGKSAAYLHAAQQTGLLKALEENLPLEGEAAHAAAQLIFLQILGRAERAQSRRRMGRRWYPRSGLPLYWPVPHATDRAMLATLRLLFGTRRTTQDGEMVLTRARVRRIEEQVLRTLLAKGLDLRYLLFDGTNFFTYHQGVRGDLFHVGRSKERRYDKRLMGLGLATAGEIPVLSEVVPGNMGDVEVFANAFEALVRRLEHLEVATKRLTIVFDRGVNSTENFDEVLGAMHVIAALDRPQGKELFEVPLEQFTEVARDGTSRPILGYAARWSGFEREWRALVTFREATATKERADWEEARAKALKKVAALRRKAPRKKEKVVVNELADAIPRNYRGMFSYGVEALEVTRSGKKVTRYQPRGEVDAKAESKLRASFGKTVVITDLEEKEAPDGELVRGWVL